LAAAAVDPSAVEELASAAGELPTTKELLFAQTDLPSSDDIPTPPEVAEHQGGGSHGKSGRRKRKSRVPSEAVTYSQDITFVEDRPKR
jgi:hypothetical protein